MKTVIDCIPCLVNQSFNIINHATSDAIVREQCMRDILVLLSSSDYRMTPPEIVQLLQRKLKKRLNNNDLYYEHKQRFTKMALAVLPVLKARIVGKSNYKTKAVQLAVVGNVIDLGAKWNLKEDEVMLLVERTMSTSLEGNVDEFFAAVEKAGRILYLADNAGELVFDRLLLELLPKGKVTLAVRGKPVLNDAVMDDARQSGITGMAEVIDNGSDAPGTLLHDCSENFLDYYHQADLVIAKGQGNFETLCEENKAIFFLLNVKCPIIAEKIGCDVGTMVLTSNHKEV